MGYVLFMFMHRAHACASARVVIHSLIFGRILLKCAGHKLHMTIRYMGYILIMFTHRAHACERVLKSSLIYGRILFKLFMSTPHVHACL
jgi:hypothetical protein